MLRNIIKALLLLTFCLLQSHAFADSEAWTYGQTDDKTARWAMVLNDSAGAFAQRCEPGDEACYWFIAIQTSCEKGSVFPMLASSDVGATHVSAYCDEPIIAGGKTLYKYYFQDFDIIDKLVRGTSGPIGFAMALKSGQFRVIRFNMTNALNAIDSMRSLTQSDIDKKPKKKTKDQVL